MPLLSIGNFPSRGVVGSHDDDPQRGLGTRQRSASTTGHTIAVRFLRRNSWNAREIEALTRTDEGTSSRRLETGPSARAPCKASPSAADPESGARARARLLLLSLQEKKGDAIHVKTVIRGSKATLAPKQIILNSTVACREQAYACITDRDASHCLRNSGMPCDLSWTALLWPVGEAPAKGFVFVEGMMVYKTIPIFAF
jgi:hypothetical protein